jgi:hypothetical protein
VENPADQLNLRHALGSIFVLFRLPPALCNFICARFWPLWG